MRLTPFSLIGLAGLGLLLAGCVYVPPTPYSPGYYAPAAAVPVAPRPYYYRPYYYPY